MNALTKILYSVSLTFNQLSFELLDEDLDFFRITHIQIQDYSNNKKFVSDMVGYPLECVRDKLPVVRGQRIYITAKW